jgi:hypothetical protein
MRREKKTPKNNIILVYNTRLDNKIGFENESNLALALMRENEDELRSLDFNNTLLRTKQITFVK